MGAPVPTDASTRASRRWLALTLTGFVALAACASEDRVFGDAASASGTGGASATVATSGTSGAGTCGAATCPIDRYCDGATHECVAKKPAGASCSAPSECANDICAGGVCCAAACKDQGADSCGTNGSCDAKGACALYPKGTACGAGSCTNGAEQGASTCDGAGKCVAGATTSCAPYVCGATACNTSCTVETDCVAGDYCNAGTCLPKKAQGISCTSGSECATGFCAQGYCCNTACTGVCRSCDGAWNLSGTNGTCGAIDGGDPYNQCAGTYTCCSGVCRSPTFCL